MKYFPFAQSLRGVAALWVVLFHAEEGGHVKALIAAAPWLNPLFTAGHLGVPMFFALSGFVIAHSTANFQPSAGNYGRFIVRRSLRLDPPYWVSMAFVVALGLLSARIKHEPFAVPHVGTVATHMLYLQGILKSPEISPVYWTLTYEFQFYLFFVGMLVLKHRIVWLLMFALAVASALQIFPDVGLFVNLWSAFFIGVLACKGIEDRNARIAACALAAVMLASLDIFLAGSVVTAFLLWLCAVKGVERQPRVLLGLGAISYSLYLFHNPLTGAVGFMIHKIIGEGVAADLVALVAIIATSIAGAAAVWWLVERPSHGLSRRISMERRAQT